MKHNGKDSVATSDLNQALLDKITQLELRLGKRDAELVVTQQKLERLVDERSAFVSSVSHDLKTPLTGIKLFAGLAMNQKLSDGKKDRDMYLSVISSEADRLSSLISNVADYQAICDAKVEWLDEPTVLVPVLEKCVRPFVVLFDSKGLEFSYELSLDERVVMLDKNRLARIVFNLLSNALKFTRQGEVRLVAKMDVEGDGLCISVSDTGQGCSAEQLKKVLSSSTEIPALADGVGLFVSSYIATHYHGRIWAESVVGEGSVFHLELPLSEYEYVDN